MWAISVSVGIFCIIYNDLIIWTKTAEGEGEHETTFDRLHPLDNQDYLTIHEKTIDILSLHGMGLSPQGPEVLNTAFE